MERQPTAGSRAAWATLYHLIYTKHTVIDVFFRTGGRFLQSL